MNGALEFLNRLGPARLAAMAAVTLMLVAFFAFVIMRVSQPAMGVLYTDLSLQDASTIIRDLEARGIHHETRNDGQTILVPRAEISRLRMDLAGKGLPTGGGVGYEIFDKGDAFSSTSFVQNINHLRALEGELSRTISSIGRVQTARVHLVLPERRLFERDREPPRASIALKLQGELDAGQIRAIRHLVASAVEGLKPERVSIVDEQGRLLADGAGSDQALTGIVADEKQTALERRLRSQVSEIVAGVVGPGRARVQVAAELDFNRVESRSETFDPESRVVRSTQTRTESQVSGTPDGGVTVGNELPGANGQNGNGPRDASNKNEEVTNYDYSRTTRAETLEGGRLKRLSVAVLVDGTYAQGQNGEQTYQPRTPEELERIAALVRTAVGFDRNRGDQIEVVNLRFAEAPQPVVFVEESLLTSLINPTKEDILRLIEIGVIALLTVIVLWAVVRPLLKQVIGPELQSIKSLVSPGGGEFEMSGTQGAISGPNRDNLAAKMIELAKVNGEIQQQSLDRIGELVQAHPNETVSVLREWIHERS